MPELISSDGSVDVRVWTPVAGVEPQALKQLGNIARLPWAFHHVAVMPDCHFGIGATAGSVIAMKNALAPAAVGVDLGCGMGAVRTDLQAADLPDSLKEIRTAIEAAIPVGFHKHQAPVSVGGELQEQIDSLHAEYKTLTSAYVHGLTRKGVNVESNAFEQLGTLGGGNHFIELCLDTEGNVWLMLHSGSRNIGKLLAEVHIAAAKTLAHNQDLPDRDLAVFLAGTPEMDAYRRDLFWAQRYAMLNRKVMMQLFRGALGPHLPAFSVVSEVWCHHNYVAEETHYGEEVLVTRKGAISAMPGQLGIIPGSMGTRSFIVEGLGNPESFCSASHGAGRRMSRGQAKRTFTTADLETQTAGVECRKDADVLDEIPGAYKDIGEVMANQADLVRIKHELRQVLCVKG